eukprot:TRINITY_DN13309_c0_g1_i1.p1 TRINITY_DN13309_c0_g1~~TRINITY_DN13309_c0_g1_i1.p1  ORF type:complete len:276 (-),score=37.44 TRINITY_DN13309_c0_g1_i1:44-871(-)
MMFARAKRRRPRKTITHDSPARSGSSRRVSFSATQSVLEIEPLKEYPLWLEPISRIRYQPVSEVVQVGASIDLDAFRSLDLQSMAFLAPGEFTPLPGLSPPAKRARNGSPNAPGSVPPDAVVRVYAVCRPDFREVMTAPATSRPFSFASMLEKTEDVLLAVLTARRRQMPARILLPAADRSRVICITVRGTHGCAARVTGMGRVETPGYRFPAGVEPPRPPASPPAVRKSVSSAAAGSASSTVVSALSPSRTGSADVRDPPSATTTPPTTAEPGA